MTIDFDKMNETDLLRLVLTYKEFIDDEPDSTFAEIFSQRIIQIRLALARK